MCRDRKPSKTTPTVSQAITTARVKTHLFPKLKFVSMQHRHCMWNRLKPSYSSDVTLLRYDFDRSQGRGDDPQ